jgi:tetratricopeptide (TPR) repeat protein
MEVAQNALATGTTGFGDALRQWENAIQIARNAGSSARTKQAIARMVLGRANALDQEEGPRQGERLTEALELLAAVRRLLGDVEEAQLRGKEAEILTDRGVWYGSGCTEFGEDPDFERAENDLRLALELNPESIRTVMSLASALVFGASSLSDAVNRTKRRVMVAEGLKVLYKGMQRTSGHHHLRRVLLVALEQLQEMVLEGLTMEQLSERFREIDNRAKPEANAGTQAAGSPTDTVETITTLITALRKNPADEESMRRLIEILQRGDQKTPGEGEATTA